MRDGRFAWQTGMHQRWGWPTFYVRTSGPILMLTLATVLCCCSKAPLTDHESTDRLVPAKKAPASSAVLVSAPVAGHILTDWRNDDLPSKADQVRATEDGRLIAGDSTTIFPLVPDTGHVGSWIWPSTGALNFNWDVAGRYAMVQSDCAEYPAVLLDLSSTDVFGLAPGAVGDVAESRGIVVSLSNPRCRKGNQTESLDGVTAWDLNNQLLWHKDPVAGCGQITTDGGYDRTKMAVQGDKVAVLSICGLDHSQLRMMDISTGTIVWQKDINRGADYRGRMSLTMLGDGRTISSIPGSITVLDANGDVVYEDSTACISDQCPFAISSNILAIANTTKSELVGIDLATGRTVWTLAAYASSLFASSRFIFITAPVGKQGEKPPLLYRIVPKTGSAIFAQLLTGEPKHLPIGPLLDMTSIGEVTYIASGSAVTAIELREK